MILSKIIVRKWLTWFLQCCAENGGQVPVDIDPFLPWKMPDEKRLTWALAEMVCVMISVTAVEDEASPVHGRFSRGRWNSPSKAWNAGSLRIGSRSVSVSRLTTSAQPLSLALRKQSRALSV